MEETLVEIICCCDTRHFIDAGLCLPVGHPKPSSCRAVGPTSEPGSRACPFANGYRPGRAVPVSGWRPILVPGWPVSTPAAGSRLVQDRSQAAQAWARELAGRTAGRRSGVAAV